MLQTVPAGYRPLSPRDYAAASSKLQSLSSFDLQRRLAEAQTKADRENRLLSAEYARLDRQRSSLARNIEEARGDVAAILHDVDDAVVARADARETLANLRTVAEATGRDVEEARAELARINAELELERARAATLRASLAEATAERVRLAEANKREETRIWNARATLSRKLLRAQPIDAALEALTAIARDAPRPGTGRRRAPRAARASLAA